MTPLSRFVRQHSEEILIEWEAFARSLPVGASMDVVALRDHAEAMLDVIARDLEQTQTARQQEAKAKGASDADGQTIRTAATQHGSGRAESGFTVNQMVAEFRALRASVLRLWGKEPGPKGEPELEDMVRFNEAIDQAIAESLARYTRDIDHTKERFLAILGHDLRTPLGAIITAAQFILESGELVAPNRELVDRIGKTSRRMNQMVADLLDFSRTRLGDRIPIAPAEMDMTKMLGDAIAEVAATYPDRKLEVETSGELHGVWDCARLTQAMTNLIGNAVEHGSDAAPITVTARGEAHDIMLAVHNDGPAIPEELVRQLFQPMRRGGSDAGDRRHLGLGLYIVDRIVTAHGGRIDVASSEHHGTTFTVRLPRQIPIGVAHSS
jgi:signal transduction histidine kinase